MTNDIKDTWKHYAETTLQNCAEDPAFGEYTAREKYLAYCFTLLEVMKPDKVDIQMQVRQIPSFLRSGAYKDFKEAFQSFTEVLIDEGVQRGEIQARPFIAGIYPGIFWASVISVITFWINDNSENSEQTDVAVEKIVHLVFDSIAPNAFDSAFDLLQFLVKQRLNG